MGAVEVVRYNFLHAGIQARTAASSFERLSFFAALFTSLPLQEVCRLGCRPSICLSPSLVYGCICIIDEPQDARLRIGSLASAPEAMALLPARLRQSPKPTLVNDANAFMDQPRILILQWEELGLWRDSGGR
jgi:hypothetical protein